MRSTTDRGRLHHWGTKSYAAPPLPLLRFFVYLILVELEFGDVCFWEEGKTGVPGEKPLGARKRTKNSTQICRRRRDLNTGHIGGRQVLSPLRHPLLTKTSKTTNISATKLHVSIPWSCWSPIRKSSVYGAILSWSGKEKCVFTFSFIMVTMLNA